MSNAASTNATGRDDAESLLNIVLESAPSGIVVADESGAIVLANRRTVDLFGYGREELTELTVEDLMPERFRGTHCGHRQQYSKNREPRQVGAGRDLFAKRRDGSEFPVEIGLSPVVTPRGKMVVASIVDISERKRAEAQLELQSQVLGNVHDAVMLVSPDGIFQTWNAGAEAVYGYPSNEAIGQNCRLILPPEDQERFTRVFDSVLANKRHEFSTTSIHQSGKRIAVSVRATLLRSAAEEPTGVVICVSDITDRKELEQKVLEVSEAEQRRIGQDIHDDLCQQLASIGCLTKVLEQRLDQVYVEGAESLAQIGDMVSQANVRAREIARGLAPSMLESEGLAGALRDLAERTRSAYRIECVSRSPETLEITDAKMLTHLYRIAQEAVNNATRHAEPTRIEIAASIRDRRLKLSVEDNGSGIADPARGRGMGLLTMAHRTQLIGGEFDIHTSPGGGTRIQCEVPLT